MHPTSLPSSARTSFALSEPREGDMSRLPGQDGCHSHHDHGLLDLLRDSYQEFDNALRHNKQITSLRKAIKSQRCNQAMIAALNASNPGLNLFYCDGLKEFDALLRQVESAPGPSCQRAVTRAGDFFHENGFHYLAIQIQKNASGRIHVLCLDSVGSSDIYEQSLFQKLLATHENVRCLITPMDVQHSDKDCPIHAIYLLQQLHRLDRRNAHGFVGGLHELCFSEPFAVEKKFFDIDFYGLMDSATACDALPQAIRDQTLAGAGIRLRERIEANRVPSSDGKTYCRSVDLYRVELLGLTIKWVASTPYWDVHTALKKARPRKAGLDWLNRIPLTPAKKRSGRNDATTGSGGVPD